MDTRQIMCSLRYVSLFLGVFPSVLLPRHPIALSGTLIVNTDPHTKSSSHWLAIHFQSRSHYPYYFDSYVVPPCIPSIQSFIRHNSLVWDYNTVQLQGPTSTSLRQILMSLRPVHGQWLYAKTVRRAPFYSDLPQAGFGHVSCRNLGLYVICLEEGSAAAVKLKRK